MPTPLVLQVLLAMTLSLPPGNVNADGVVAGERKQLRYCANARPPQQVFRTSSLPPKPYSFARAMLSSKRALINSINFRIRTGMISTGVTANTFAGTASHSGNTLTRPDP
jgi:hypothetical protein